MLYISKFQNWRKFDFLPNFFVWSVTGSWICYPDSHKNPLHFDILIDALAQILTSDDQEQATCSLHDVCPGSRLNIKMLPPLPESCGM